ncbi:hypothetical protein [Marinobacter oulmenensis]|uniref:Uncharacterized protein n=1 Tax=Marinobacter oulmenensis TaxID=643747 RepID=A0A840UKM1_9GAMM|nr:hypothetical protein [Marinobacter oulmenensis]MBB5321646.1 hypothetical protein [Marinobacter oulmenensis]
MNLPKFMESNWLKASFLLYGVGLVVHNSYLAQFGIQEYELVEARYIVSGVGFIGFVVVCCTYMAIKVNLSYIGDSLKPKQLLPWLFRIFSLPYVVHLALFGNTLKDTFGSDLLLTNFVNGFTALAQFMVLFSVSDLVFMTSDGDKKPARVVRSLIRVWSVPFLLFTAFLAYSNAEFRGTVWATTYFFFLFLGLALVQSDSRHGVDPKYLDPNTSKEHEDRFQIIFGLLACFYIFWLVVTNYTENIYQRMPASLGGAKTFEAKIYTEEGSYEGIVLYETDSWLVFRAGGDNIKIVKIKADIVEKIEVTK